MGWRGWSSGWPNGVALAQLAAAPSGRTSLCIPFTNCAIFFEAAIWRPLCVLGRCYCVLEQSCICILVHATAFSRRPGRQAPSYPKKHQTAISCMFWASCVAPGCRRGAGSTRADRHALVPDLRRGAGKCSYDLSPAGVPLASLCGSQCACGLVLVPDERRNV